MDKLNSEQLKAVKTIDGSVLILAGAGSGKTKTLIERVAFLTENGIDPDDILVLTFTNRASKEMRDRASQKIKTKMPLFCTFHKFGYLFLKRYIHILNRENNFNVIDTSDCKSIVKQIDSDANINLVLSNISNFKNNLISPEVAKLSAEIKKDIDLSKIYELYEEELRENNLVDFDDLLYLTYKILDSDERIAKRFSDRFKYIMVDEYQDTNYIQFAILQKLTLSHNNICVVGDDDQSIYGFRGAIIENILQFDKLFKDTKIIKLEKNYRSSGNILKVANKIIQNNSIRHDKKLVSTKALGERVKYLNFGTQSDEAKEIAKLIKNSNSKDIAVLYRVNAISRSIEEALNIENIAYSVLGGVKFYEREEIKDLVSYFRVISNPNDDFSLRRVLNRPKRGVGKSKIEKIESNKKNSIYEFISQNSEDILSKLLTKSVATNLKQFVKDIKELQNVTKNPPEEFLKEFFGRIDIKSHYQNRIQYSEKLENIYEFCSLFVESNKSLDEFLATISLESRDDILDNEKRVSLMSVHSSKGLEFDTVFIIGLEEGIFPVSESDIEEERRLCYVAITRAKRELFLCSSDFRAYNYKQGSVRDKSRFLYECGFISDVKSKFRVGDVVKHKIFGFGRVLEVSKIQNEVKLRIDFGGVKRDILGSFVEEV